MGLLGKNSGKKDVPTFSSTQTDSSQTSSGCAVRSSPPPAHSAPNISSAAQTDAQADRVIRVFISSTFRDMKRERELLVKKIFPELRRKCAKRFVTFSEVDLRWGITEEQAAEGQVLPLCLAEIERCRPYFIGLLGERYGWIPDTIPPQIIEREAWLQKYVHDRTSVTELEILHGALNNPKMAEHAFFYFRDPAYGLDPEKFPELTEDDRRDLAERDIPDEIRKYSKTVASRHTEERKNKLNALKQRIRDSQLPLTDPYATPEALTEIVREQFDKLIDDLYPEDLTPDLLMQEHLAHQAYAKIKLFGCIERPAHMKALTDFVGQADKGGKGLVVTGESGGGKTTLLAAWARNWAQTHPKDWIFQHYFGATPESASTEGFLRRLMGELKQRFDIHEDIPSDPNKLRDALPVWLAMTPRDSRTILILDGLNQVQGDNADLHLRFLPNQFPPQVRILASALPGPALDALRKRSWSEYELPQASEAEADSMAAEYLRLIGRFVDADGNPIQTPLRRQIIAAPGSRNPLFLRTVLDELRQFGNFEALPKCVTHYLEARDPKELFLRVIRRWQEDFDGKDPAGRDLDLVRRVLTSLWAARQGLSETEWLDMLGSDDVVHPNHTQYTLTPFPRALWTPLFLALEPHLSQRAGLFTFGHDFLRQAVEQIWLAHPDAQHKAHLVIANYFEHHPSQAEMTPRKATEWPFQLHATQDWERLEACLIDIPLFLALYNDRTKWQLTSYWLPLRTKPLGRDMAKCYTEAYRTWCKAPENATDYKVSASLGRFFLDNGLYPAAEKLLNQALSTREQILGPEHPDTLGSVNDLALLRYSKGDYAGARPLFARILSALKRVQSPRLTLAIVNNLAAFQEAKGDYEGVKPLFEWALEARKRVLGEEHPDTISSMNNMAHLLCQKGDYAGAQPLLEQALEASERVLGSEHPHTLTCICNLAGLLQSKGDFAGALPLFERALEAFERVLGPEHPSTLTCMNNLAVLLKRKGDYSGALPLYERMLEVSERVLGLEHPSTLTCICNLAVLLKSKGDFAGALPLFKRALEACERVLGSEHPSTLACMASLAGFLYKRGDYANAQTLYERALEVSERVLGPEHPSTLAHLTSLAGLHEAKGDYVNAQLLLERTLEASERVMGPEHPDTITSVNTLALLLYHKGDYENAQPLFERALEASERVLGPEHPSTLESMHNLAELMMSKGDYAGAQPLLERALEASERVLGPEHPSTLASMHNLAHFFYQKGDYEGAQPLYERVLEVNEHVLGPEHPHTLTCLCNLAVLLQSKGNYAGALPLFERALKARERVLGPEHPSTLGSVNNLACLLFEKGDYAGAQPLIERTLETCEQVLGPEHPHTLTCVNNLARLLEAKGDYVGAKPLHERALETKERKLGLEHPDTITSVNNLAGLLYKIGDYAGAQPLFDRALEIRKRVLGPKHPDTLTSMSDLAILLSAKGDHAGARLLHEQALEASEQVLGLDHPDTITSVNNLAGLLYKIGDYAGAQPLFDRALTGLLKASAANRMSHPSLPGFIQNYKYCLKKMGCSDTEISTKLNALARPYGRHF